MTTKSTFSAGFSLWLLVAAPRDSALTNQIAAREDYPR
jgi:hypothetical protein